jgi:hypothetical protein
MAVAVELVEGPYEGTHNKWFDGGESIASSIPVLGAD